MECAANRFSSISFLAAGLVIRLFSNSAIFPVVAAGVAANSVVAVSLFPIEESCSTRAIASLLTMMSPESFSISVSVPSIGEATSITTLSVSISASSSSIFTVSPTLLYHVNIVPSGTDSGKSGALISVAMFNSSKFI